MAKPELSEVVQWLGREARNRFEIYDVDKQTTLDKCASYDDLSKGGFSPETYFEKLADSGVRTVQIVKKKKNGSTYIREGCGLNFAISTDNNVAASGASVRPAATPQQSPVSSSSAFGLGSPGLGLPEIMAMRSQSDRFEECKKQMIEYKAKAELQEKEIRKLENENLKYQLGIDTKPSALDKLIEGIAANPAALPQIIQSFKGANPGLNAPQPEQPQLTDTKNIVVDLISNNAQITDEHVSAAYHVLVESLKGNQQFLNDYLKLLQQHKIIDNGGNPNHNSGNQS